MRCKTAIKPLIWVPRYWPAIGGAELHSRRLAHELSGAGEVGVLTHCDDGNVLLALGASQSIAKKNSDTGTIVHRTGLQGCSREILRCLAHWHARWRVSRPFYAFAFRQFMAAQVSNIVQNYDLVHCVYNGLTESAELAAATANKQGKPFVLTPLACTEQKKQQAWSSARFHRLYARADAMIAMTEHERQWLIKQGAVEEKVYVCPYGPLVDNAAEGQGFRQQYSLGNNPLVLFLGRVTLDKGVDYLLGAANQIWQQYPRTHIAFIGPQEAAVSALFSQCHDDRLLVIDNINQQQKNAVLDACDLLCLPSRAESLGVAYLEAWYFKKPVVALDLPVLREVIAHNEDGLLAGHSIAAVANAVCCLLDDPQRRNRMGKAGHAKLVRQYDWARIADRIVSIYAAALAGYRR